VWRQRREIRPYLVKLAILGGLGMALYQGLAYVAEATTTASNMRIITSMIPLLTIVVAALVLHTRPTLVALIGCLVSLFGLSVLLGHGDPMQLLKVGGSQGDALMGLAALAYALYGVLLRKWALPIGPWQSLYIQVFFGIVLQLPAFLFKRRVPVDCPKYSSGYICWNFPLAVCAILMDGRCALLRAEPGQYFLEYYAGRHRGDCRRCFERAIARLSRSRWNDGLGRRHDRSVARRCVASLVQVSEPAPGS
jgi:drug/metabolite transporter (DMT)-like permease